MSDKKQESKRKRTPNTSPDQILAYLNLMESDAVFRTNTLNPSIPSDYIRKTWEKLTHTLNACDNGPILTSNEWIKRFKDWKNSTRAKARKIIDNKQKTGGGPLEDIKLTTLEERALSVWGRVTVMGSCAVPVTGGLQLYLERSCLSPLMNLAKEMDAAHKTLFGEAELKSEEATQPQVELNNVALVPTTAQQTTVLKKCVPRKRSATQPIQMTRTPSENRSVKQIGEELLGEYKKNTSQDDEVKKGKLKLNIARFKFEVAKYKFEHPGFEFELNI